MGSEFIGIGQGDLGTNRTRKGLKTKKELSQCQGALLRVQKTRQPGSKSAENFTWRRGQCKRNGGKGKSLSFEET